VLLVALLILIVMQVGCGNDSAADNLAEISPSSPFEGNWYGTWEDKDNGQSGTLNIIVSSNGNVSGTIHNSTIYDNGNIAGTVSSSGTVYISLLNYTGTNTLRGSVNINGSGHIVGNLDEYDHGSVSIGTAAIDLTKQ